MCSASVGTANAYRNAGDVFWSHVVVRYVTRFLFLRPLACTYLRLQLHFLFLRLLACTYTCLLNLCSLLSLFSKDSLFLCELHSAESTIASHNTQLLFRLEIMCSTSRLLSTFSGSLKRDTPLPSACWGLGRVQTRLFAFLCESEGLLYKLAPI